MRLDDLNLDLNLEWNYQSRTGLVRVLSFELTVLSLTDLLTYQHEWVIESACAD